MARPTPELIAALRQTALRLADGVAYQWTHMGACNCGHLVQTVTHRPAAEIHALALEKHGDWADKAMDYCEASGYPIDHVIGQLLDLGLYLEDIVHLERLSDPDILRALPTGRRPLNHKLRADVVLYLQVWADLLEADWLHRTALQLSLDARADQPTYVGQPVAAEA